ncbi:putative mitochondrial inner membrane protease subunit 1 [Triangularia setosa]|uniref:Mitochondrial inner membrane protease subunit n=1 Tax=Triangularia setosa TaxID=2587417 RepID=A0AAN7AAK8_9PEZI|nr:putative mitochondrial inner membrane protease subunit 1 [Podospora setosa]
MSNLYRLRAISWRHRLSPHSSLRPLIPLSRSQSRLFRQLTSYNFSFQPPKTPLKSPSHKRYSTTASATPLNTSSQHSSNHEPPPPKDPLFRHPLRLLLSYLKLLALLHLIWNHVLSLAPAQGPSMLATYPITGTWHLTSRLHVFGRNLQVGDIVTFHIPDRPASIGVKRVIGLPGDYVLIGTPGEFWHSGADPRADDALMLQVPEGHAYLVGDNLPASNDSRIFGPVPLGLIRSKVIASMEPSFERGPFAGFQWVRNPMQRDVPPTKEEVLHARSGR